MSKTLAIIGASYLQLPLVLKAREMGLRTLCFAWAEGAVCQQYADRFFPVSVTEKEQIASICQEEKVDGVTTIATDIAVPTVAYVAARLNLVGNSEHSAYVSTNKYAMRQTLYDAGVNCPRFALAKSVQDAKLALDRLAFPLIVKPCDRSGSMGVMKVTAVEQLESAVREALQMSLCGEAVMEEFIEDAREISIEGISYAGSHYVLAVTDKVTTGSPHYVELGHHQPSDLSPSLIEEAIRQVKLGVKALNIRFGASHPELMITPDGKVYVTEIGARMGGDFIGSDLVQLSTGYDFLRGVIDVALGNFAPPSCPIRKCSGVWFYAPQTLWVKDAIDRREHSATIIRSELQENSLKELTRSADRAGYFIYQSENRIEQE